MLSKSKKILASSIAGAMLFILHPVSSALAADFELVTMDEYTESVNAGDNPKFDFMSKAVPGGPRIKVLAPTDTGGTLQSPVDIEVAFESAGGATIDMSSLKIYYLMFIKKDVTDRIMEHATTGADSIQALGAELPSGKHKFLVEIRDSENRRSSQKFVVKVGK